VCTVSDTTVTLVAAGACTIQASQAGNADYTAAATITHSFTVHREAQTITFATIPTKTYGEAPFTVSATASSGLTVSFASTTPLVCTVSDTTVTLVAAGTCTIEASQAGNADYTAATTVSRSFKVNKEAQTITFTAPQATSLSAKKVSLSATASSGLTVSFASTTSTVCTVSDTTVTLVKAGTCAIEATQAGSADYAAAATITRSFAVKAN
jgi:hypothetical protein